MELLRTQTYVRALKRLAKLGASVDDIARMGKAVLDDPKLGAVIPGGNGLRKIRFGYGGRGKRGGGRTIYYVSLGPDLIYLITAYAKVDQGDVAPNDLRLYRDIIRDAEDE